MGSVNLVVIVESARTLIAKEGDELKPFHLPSIIAVGAALGENKVFLMSIPLNLACHSCQVSVILVQLLSARKFQSSASPLARSSK